MDSEARHETDGGAAEDGRTVPREVGDARAHAGEDDVREADGPAETSRFLRFRLGNEDYAFPVMQVQEIIGFARTTALPNTPPHVLGVMNLRGSVIPILDLGVRLGMSPVQRTERTVNIVVDLGERTLGFVVDAVLDVVDVATRSIEAPPPGCTGGEEGLVRGFAQRDGQLLTVLDVERMVAEELREDAVPTG